MDGVAASTRQAVGLMLDADGPHWPIVALSLKVRGLATLIAASIALPLAVWLALTPFPGRGAMVAVLNALMGRPARRSSDTRWRCRRAASVW
jgi:tungstate transport system permease protein